MKTETKTHASPLGLCHVPELQLNCREIPISVIFPCRGFECKGLLTSVTPETRPSSALGIRYLRVSSQSELMRVLMPIAAISLLLASSGCEVSTSAKIHQGPAFSLNGSGRLVFFRVYGPRPGRKIATPVDAQSLMWSIEPTSDSPSGVLVTGMEIAYGRVPRGYLQKFPPTR